MNHPLRLEFRARNTGDLAFAVVLLAAYVLYFAGGAFRFDPLLTPLALVLGVVYLFTGSILSGAVERLADPRLSAAVLVLNLLIGAAIIFSTNGQGWLVLLPQVSFALENFRSPWNWVGVVCTWLTQIVAFYFLAGLGVAAQWAMPFLAAAVFVAVFTQANMSERRARAELAQANQKLREYMAQSEELAVTQERNRLAREIHDGLGHYLTAINIQIKAAQAMSAEDPAVTAQALEKAQSLTAEALSDVRRSISALRADPSTSRPLPETLSRVLSETGASGVHTQFTLIGAPRPLPPQVEFALYRVAQEGLTNTRKHARATQVDLVLEYRPDCVRVTVRDNGVGAARPDGGFGLLGLRERGELLGGKLTVETAPEQGFELTMEIPA